MPSRVDPSTSAARPDLEEFLSALDGFLHKPVSPSDPRYFKFLGTFCRSIGATDGHLLMKNENHELESVISFGMDKSFDADFNKVQSASAERQTPLLASLDRKEVIAVVDLKKETNLPGWYKKILVSYKISSMVAVPLIGKNEALGVLCAYYHDVCLFDQGTADHLMMIGRMVGSALEQEEEKVDPASHKEKKSVIDDFLRVLRSESFSKLELYSLVAKTCHFALAATGTLSGPLREGANGLTFTIAAGHGVPSSSISDRVPIPPFLEPHLKQEVSPKIFPSIKVSQWGKLGPYLKAEAAYPLACPIMWHGKPNGALVCWRAKGPAFQPSDALVLSRLAGIISLALNVKD